MEQDREMASFRAITGEEEAATALMMAVQLKGYPGADRFNPRNHHHKAAVVACVVAIGKTLQPVLAEFQLTFHFEKGRIDMKIPLSTFGVANADGLGLQFVEPLGLLHVREGVPGDKVFAEALSGLVDGSEFANVRKLIAAQANSRNRLLYASDKALPKSEATAEGLENRKNRALTMLVLTVMVLQSSTHQAMVTQAVPAFLSVISKVPEDPT